MSIPDTALALWFVGERRVEIRDEKLRAMGDRAVLVHALASGVSHGTELLLYRGEGPENFDPSLAEGTNHGPSEQSGPKPISTYPRRYGYAWVGEVIGAGAEANMPIGTRVFALATHGEAHVLEAGAVRALPEDCPATRAVLAANLETAITCVWDAQVGLGDDAVVVGGGVVGILTAWLLARSGANVTLVEPSAKRREAARVLVPAARIVAQESAHVRADVIVEATGHPAMLDVAVAWARPEARIVVASFYGKRRAAIDLGDAFHRRRLELRASQVSSIPPRLRERWSPDRRWLLVLSLLEERALDALVAPPVPFARAGELYACLDTDADLPPAHVFVYR